MKAKLNCAVCFGIILPSFSKTVFPRLTGALTNKVPLTTKAPLMQSPMILIFPLHQKFCLYPILRILFLTGYSEFNLSPLLGNIYSYWKQYIK